MILQRNETGISNNPNHRRYNVKIHEAMSGGDFKYDHKYEHKKNIIKYIYIYIYILIYVTYQKEENLNFTIFKSITGYEPYL